MSERFELSGCPRTAARQLMHFLVSQNLIAPEPRPPDSGGSTETSTTATPSSVRPESRMSLDTEEESDTGGHTENK